MIYLKASHIPPGPEVVHDEETQAEALQGSSRLEADAHVQADVALRGVSCVHHSDEENTGRVAAVWTCDEHAMVQMLKSADLPVVDERAASMWS